jgi:triosephosphate isomerase (TIM)
MSKKYFLGFNWKMNPNNLQTAKELLRSYQQALSQKTFANLEIVTFVPNLYFSDLDVIKKEYFLKNLHLGSQDISDQSKGAFSGQISGEMLLDFGIKYTLIGHSETREAFSLSDQNINQKVVQSLKNQIIPVLCIGYSKKPEVDLEELKSQVLEGLKNCSSFLEQNLDQQIILAYEPVWAIGSGKAADVETINKVLIFLKDLIKQEIPAIFSKIKVLYGGSVTDQNILEFSKVSALEGFLIGGASLSNSKFEPILNNLNSNN